jgi:Mg-chelatase subunit ChlD
MMMFSCAIFEKWIVSHHRQTPRGTISVFTIFSAVSLIVLGFATVNLISFGDAEEELQNVADTAAISATRALLNHTEIAPKPTAARIAESLSLFGRTQTIEAADVLIGNSKKSASGKYVFRAGGQPANSVRVIANRMQGHASGSTPVVGGGLLGIGEINLKCAATATFADQDIAIVVDCSGFMHGPDRFEEASRAFRAMLDTLQNNAIEERVSLTTFSKEGDVICPLTTDLGECRAAFDDIKLRGPRNIDSGITEGLRSLFAANDRRDADKSLILLSECRDTSDAEIAVIGDRLRRLDVNLIVYTFGKQANLTFAKQLSKACSGIHAHDPSNREVEQDIVNVIRQATVFLCE